MQTLFAYPETTTSTQAASEVPTANGGATDSHLDVPDLAGALCARTSAAAEWVPTPEARLVPTELTIICRACPVRQACLTAALARDVQGYWAATTAADRLQMNSQGLSTTAEADQIQDAVFDEEYPEHNHTGSPSLGHYNRGCRAAECRQRRAEYRMLHNPGAQIQKAS